MKTKGKFRFSAAHSNLTTLQTNTNAAQAVRSITLAQQLKRSSAAPTNHNNKFYKPETKKVIISERADFDEQFFMNKRHSSPQLPPPRPDSLVEPSPPIVQLPDTFDDALEDSDLSQQSVHGGDGSVTSELPPARPESPPARSESPPSPSVFHTAPTSSSPPASTLPTPAPMVEPAPSRPQHQRRPREEWLTEQWTVPLRYRQI